MTQPGAEETQIAREKRYLPGRVQIAKNLLLIVHFGRPTSNPTCRK